MSGDRSQLAQRLRVGLGTLTVEDVYATLAPAGSHGTVALERRSSRGGAGAGGHGAVIHLAPLDAEACLREGVDPHDLYDRPLEEFKEAGLDPAIARLVSARRVS